MEVALALAQWLTGRWWTKPLGWGLYGCIYAIMAVAALVCVAFALALVGGILYGVGYGVATSNPVSAGLFLAAAVVGVGAAALWWSVDHEGKGMALGALAAVLAVAWYISIPNEPPKPGSRAAFCEKHECVGNFDEGRGYRIQCADGVWSFSGGIQGSCSSHGGNGDGF
jgi:hypothetical protein